MPHYGCEPEQSSAVEKFVMCMSGGYISTPYSCNINYRYIYLVMIWSLSDSIFYVDVTLACC